MGKRKETRLFLKKSSKKKIGEMRSTARRKRKETIISALRFRHVRLSSTLFNLVRHCNGKCEYCGVDETVEHVMLHCQNYKGKTE